METFPVANKGDQKVAFAIKNIYVSGRTIARLLDQAEGVTDVRLRGRFGSSEDIRIEFKYLDRDYIVWEPFGDNSQYWIGPRSPDEGADEIIGVENIFKRYRPPLHRVLLGDLLTLKSFKRFATRD
ncbi:MULTISPECIES: hypothetical protein [Luteibacter]|uniref:hypothetical protein n=1 Tax=Luteibacter TaxID=242605 RepID=UPI0005621287|nr:MULTISPECIES: hypothetical protein [unclassified Luteibacter]